MRQYHVPGFGAPRLLGGSGGLIKEVNGDSWSYHVGFEGDRYTY